MQACNTCKINTQHCKEIHDIFARKKMDHGYQYIDTVPAGACNVLITLNQGSWNFLALRWISKDKFFFLNGDWKIQKSGNYTIHHNAFNYLNAYVSKGETAGDQVQFYTQLTHSMEVYLIIQSKNMGVNIRYQLPQQQHEVMSQKYANKPTISSNGTVIKAGSESEASDFAETVKLGHDRRHSNPMPYKTRLNAKKSSWLPLQYQADSALGSSRPAWVNDLHNIMNSWFHDLEEMKKTMKARKEEVDGRLRDLEAEDVTINSYISKLYAADNAIKLRLDALETSDKTKASQIATLEKTSTSHGSQIADLSATDQEHGTKIKANEATQAKLSNQIKFLEASLQDVNLCQIGDAECQGKCGEEVSGDNDEQYNSQYVYFSKAFPSTPKVMMAMKDAYQHAPGGSEWYGWRMETESVSKTGFRAVLFVRDREFTMIRGMWIACT